MSNKTIVEPGLSLVLYTDGGCKPNPNGNGGMGGHGYFWQPKQTKQGSGHPSHVPTDIGYLLKADYREIEAQRKPIAVEVEPVCYIDYVATDAMSTNNRTELIAFAMGIEYATAYQVKHVSLYTDSMYVLHRYARMDLIHKSDYKVNGEPAANEDMLRRLYQAIHDAQAKGITIEAHKVAGHSGHPGNDAADLAASTGVALMTNRQARIECDISPAKGYWRNDVDRHPLITGQCMYFYTDPASFKPGRYLLGSHGSASQMLGTRQTDGSYAIVELNESSEVMEIVRSVAAGRADNRGHHCLMFATLDKLFNARNFRLATEYQGDVIVERDADMHLYMLKARASELYLEALEPPLYAWRAMDALAQLEQIASHATELHPSVVVTDITSEFYDHVTTTKKGVESTATVLRDHFKVGYREHDTLAACKSADKELTLPARLILGVDLPNRNVLKRIEAEEPCVRLVTWAESDSAWRYAVMINTRNARGIWAGWYSNFLFESKAPKL